VITLARSVADAELLALQREVERDIALGAAPLAAAAGRLATTDAATTTAGTGTPSPPARRKP
jgi:hypothetical protein